MTISSTNRIAGPYIGAGTTATFPFTFKVFSASDIEVVQVVVSTGAQTTLTLTTDYTVALNGNQNTNPGGSITLVAGNLASGVNLTITSDIANLQPTDLTNQGGFYPEVINDSLDRATIQIQQLNDTITRTIRVPVSDGVTANQELPTKELRANKYFFFDSNGNPTVAAGTSGAAVTAANNVTITANSAGTNVGRDTIVLDNTTELARFVGATQRVGIGTAAPATTLDVRKNTATTDMLNGPTGRGLFMLRDATATSEYTCLDFAQANGTVTGRVGVLYGASGSTMQFGTSNNYAIGITNTALSIDSAGIVTAATRFAVGTSTPLTIWKGLAGEANSIGIGNNALAGTTSATGCVVLGVGSGNNITTGANNVVLGNSAGSTVTTGTRNIAVGNSANATQAGTNNSIAIGHESIAGGSSVSVGYRAGNGATGATPNFNVLIGNGVASGASLTALANSVLIGADAGNSANASQLVGIGINALYNATGTQNVAVGTSAGLQVTTGTNNTFVGHQASGVAGSGTSTGSNNTCLGYQAIPSTQTVSNTITLGNSSIATLRCQVNTITLLSDRRDKKDIEDLPSVMPLIDALRPRSFNWNMRDGGKVDVPEFGFIAQELIEAQQQSGITVPGLVSDINPDRLEAGPGTLLPVLLQAIKELKSTVESQAARIAALEAGA